MKPRVAHHRKLSAEALAIFQHEAEKRLQIKTYKQLSIESGLAIGTVQQLMGQLMREKRDHKTIVHRGTQLVDVENLASSATLR